MTDTAANPQPIAALPGLEDGPETPAGLQTARMLTRRRVFVAALNLITMAVLATLIARLFGAGGWSLADIVIMAAFLLGAPWTVMGFWNAVIGLALLHGGKRGLASVAPHLAAAEGDAPIRARVAVTMFLRNEDPERAFDRLAETRASLDRTGFGDRYDVFILSDTDDAACAAVEGEAFERRKAEMGPRVIYRRRAKNDGFKAGNIRDFVRRWGGDYDFFLPLDSDSLMAGEDILRMTRVMQAHPRIGILQSLVVGAPAESAFARIFQFGMRHGMRSFTMGAAWWHGDCGPYWGHNALVRVAPFRAKCRLPILPGEGPLSGYILSHDQIEAALMRRAGYEVRVAPVEGGSWEDNPPTLFDFTKRDLRWCQGNMQYWRLMGLKGLKPMSRFQIFAAMMMYFGAPAWMAMTSAAAFKLFENDFMTIDYAFAVSMFFIMFAVSLFPKIAGWIDVALRPGGVASYGGRRRFVAGAVLETLFSIMLAPVVAFRVTMFMVGLAFGKSVTWSGQARDAYRLTWATAARGLWPQTSYGVVLTLMIGFSAPQALAWAAPVLLGLTLSIPFAVLTSYPAVSAWAARRRLCATPDEFSPQREIEALAAPDGAGRRPLAA